MPIRELLMLAVTRMQGGVCIAGMTTEPDPVTGLRWVRPVREFSHILLGDISTADGTVLQPFDVVEFNLLQPHAIPPHCEDWTTDFVHDRPRIVRRLEGDRRTRFLHTYLDTAPRQVLDSQQRSLCLIKPEWTKGCFRLDGYSGRFDARISFGLERRSYVGSYAKGGLSVTDLKWRALGRTYLPANGGWAEFDAGDLEARLGIKEIFLAVGLTRTYQGTCWPIVVGVHTVPDYNAAIDYDNV
jgi:hypothetical protein